RHYTLGRSAKKIRQSAQVSPGPAFDPRNRREDTSGRLPEPGRPSLTRRGEHHRVVKVPASDAAPPRRARSDQAPAPSTPNTRHQLSPTEKGARRRSPSAPSFFARRGRRPSG